MHFNLLNYKYFKIPYITDTILNSPAGHQLPSQDKIYVCIIIINSEEPITAQGDLDDLNTHKPHVDNPRPILFYTEEELPEKFC